MSRIRALFWLCVLAFLLSPLSASAKPKDDDERGKSEKKQVDSKSDPRLDRIMEELKQIREETRSLRASVTALQGGKKMAEPDRKPEPKPEKKPEPRVEKKPEMLRPGPSADRERPEWRGFGPMAGRFGRGGFGPMGHRPEGGPPFQARPDGPRPEGPRGMQGRPEGGFGEGPIAKVLEGLRHQLEELRGKQQSPRQAAERLRDILRDHANKLDQFIKNAPNLPGDRGADKPRPEGERRGPGMDQKRGPEPERRGPGMEGGRRDSDRDDDRDDRGPDRRGGPGGRGRH